MTISLLCSITSAIAQEGSDVVPKDVLHLDFQRALQSLKLSYATTKPHVWVTPSIEASPKCAVRLLEVPTTRTNDRIAVPGPTSLIDPKMAVAPLFPACP
jgi:hypothetical protein